MVELFTENDQEPHPYVILFAEGPAKRRGFLFVGRWAVSNVMQNIIGNISIQYLC